MFDNMLIRYNNFLNSIRIRHDIIAQHVAKQLELRYGYNTNDDTDNKYYLNLSGIRHTVDPVVYVDTDNGVKELTRDLVINDNDLYREIMLKYGRYTILVENYPTMVTYINSMVNNITLDQVLSTPNNNLIYLDTSTIDSNMTDISIEINSFSNMFFSNYDNVNYIIDELYVPTLIHLFYTFLPLKVINFTFRNIDSFRIPQILREIIYKSVRYLPSKKIEEYLPLQVKLNLIRDINYLRTNIGKNETLDYILDMLKNSGISTEKVYVSNKIPNINDANVPYSNMHVYSMENEFITKKGHTLTSTEINNIRYNLGYVSTKDLEAINEEDITVLKTDIPLDTPTKLVYAPSLQNFNVSGLSNTDLIMQKLLRNINTATTSMTKPWNNEPGINANIMAITDKYMLDILIYLMLKYVDKTDIKIEKITCYNDINYNVTTNDISAFLNDTSLSTYINPISEIISNIKNTVTVSEYITLYRSLLSLLQYIISNTDDMRELVKIYELIDILYTTTTYEYNLSGTDIENMYDIVLTSEPYELANNLSLKYLGVYLSEYEDLYRKIKDIVEIFDKLTSYDSELIFDINRLRIHKLLYKTMSTNISYKYLPHGTYKRHIYTPIDITTYSTTFTFNLTYDITKNNEIHTESIDINKYPLIVKDTNAITAYTDKAVHKPQSPKLTTTDILPDNIKYTISTDILYRTENTEIITDTVVETDSNLTVINDF